MANFQVYVKDFPQLEKLEWTLRGKGKTFKILITDDLSPEELKRIKIDAKYRVEVITDATYDQFVEAALEARAEPTQVT